MATTDLGQGWCRSRRPVQTREVCRKISMQPQNKMPPTVTYVPYLSAMNPGRIREGTFMAFRMASK